MANKNIRGITVEIGGDTTKLGKALADSEKKTRAFQVELKEVEKLLKFDPTNTELLIQKQNILADQIGETSKKLDIMREAESQVIAQFERGEIAEEQLRAFQREIIQTENTLNDLQNELRTANRNLEEFGDNNGVARAELERLERSLQEEREALAEAEQAQRDHDQAVEDANQTLSEFGENASNMASNLGAGAVAIGASAVALGGYALNLSTEFDKAYNTIQTQTGATAEEMKELEKSIDNIYKSNFGENMQDVAESMATVKTQTNLAGQELEDITTKALIMRDTFGFEVNESIRAVNSMMNQFGISADEAYNLIAQGAQNGLNQNDDLLDTINEYSVQFEMLGYSADDMFNMLANGANEGTWSVDKLGDAVKEFNIRAKDGSDSTADAFAMLGLTVSDNTEAIDKAREQVGKYKEQIEKLEKNIKYAQIQQSNFTDKTSDLTKLKTADNIAKWSKELEILEGDLALTNSSLSNMEKVSAQGGQTASDLFARFAEGGESARGATEEVLTALFAMEDKVKQDAVGVALFGTMWEDLGADAVKALLDTQGEISSTSDALDKINEVKYDDIGSALSGLKRTLETDIIKPLGDDLKPAVEDVIDYVQDNAPEIKDVLSKIAKVIGEFVGYIVDHGAEIVSIIGAIGAGFVAWNVVTMIQGVVTAIKAFKLANEGATIAQWAMNVAMNANPIGIIITAITALVAGFILLWNTSDEFRAFWINLWEKIKEAFFSFIEWVSPKLEELKELFIVIWGVLKDAFLAVYESIKPVLESMILAFIEGWEMIKVAWDYVAPYFSEIWEGIKLTFSAVKEILGTYFVVAWEYIKFSWSTAVEYFKTIWINIKSVFSVVKTFFSGMFSTAWTAIKVIWNNATGYFKAIWDTIRGIFSVVKNVLSGNWSEAWESIKGIVGTWTTYFSGVWSGIKKVFGSVKKWFSETFSSAWTAVKNVFSGWSKFFSGLWSSIKTTFSKIGTNISNAISNSVKAGLNGVISSIENTINKGIRLINGAIDIINNIPNVSVGKISELNLPRLYRGGVLKKGQVGLLEGNGAEAVVPLEKETGWINRIAKKMNEFQDANPNYNNSALAEKMDELIQTTKKLKSSIVLDTGVLVGETINQIDERLGDNYSLRERRI